MKKCKIKDIAILNPTKNEVSKLGDIEVTFVPMEAVSNDGILLRKETRLLSEVKTGFTYFADDDILFAKITPCMENGKGCIAANLLNGVGFGSTEFHVIRVNKDVIYPRYLFHLLHSSQFRKQAASHMTGSAGQKRLPKKYLEEFEFILPTLEQQKVILQVLDKAQTLVDKRKQTIAKLDELVQAVFLDMFGDPVSNNKSWNEATLGDLSTLVSSGSTPLGGSQAYKEIGIPFIRSQNILMNKLMLDDIVYIDEDTHNRMKRTWVKHNDVLLNITGASIGRVAVYEGDSDFANVNQHVCIIRLKDSILIPRFCEYMISHPNYQRYIMSFNVGGTREAFNFQQIKKFKVICPPIAIQEKFLSIIKAITKNRETNLIQLQQLESNFQALLQKAFKGELTVKDGVTV